MFCTFACLCYLWSHSLWNCIFLARLKYSFISIMVITIEDLLEVPFGDRTVENRIQIVLEGKPRPALNLLAVAVANDDGVMIVQHFDSAMYDFVAWLTGSEGSQSFYCWPCLLFGNRDLMWKVSDLALLTDSISVHEKCSEHVQAALSLKYFEVKQLDKTPTMQDYSRHRQNVRKNRGVLKLLIDVLCEVIKKVPSRRGSDPHSRINQANCLKLLQLLQNYSTRSGNYADEAIEWIKENPTLLDDLVVSMNKVVEMRFKEEMKTAPFVSLVLSEHSTDPTVSQISVVARYVRDGKVLERFLGFANLLVFKTPETIHSFVLQLVERLGISAQFLSYAFDGAVLKTSDLATVDTMLKSTYPKSYFVPCYFHGLYYILQQNLSTIKEVGPFFKVLTAMETFFERSSNQWRSFENRLKLKVNLPKLWGSKIWHDGVMFVKLVCLHRSSFIEFLESMSQSYNRWSAEDVINSLGFKQFLTEFQAVFLLQVISTLFQSIAFIDESMRSAEPEKSFDMINNILRNHYPVNQEFEPIWDLAIKEYGNYDAQSAKRLKTDYCHQKHQYSQLFNDIVGRMNQDIILRYRSLQKLEFCCLLNTEYRLPTAEELEQQHGKNTSPNYLEQIIKGTDHFNVTRLQSELQVLRLNATMFNDKNIYDMLHFLSNTDFASAFQEFNKLAEFALTMSFKPSSPITDFSKFEKIKKMSYSLANSVVAIGDSSLLSVECDFLQYLKQDDVFFADDVITKFYEVNKSIELMHERM